MAQDCVPNELGTFLCFSGSPPLSLGEQGLRPDMTVPLLIGSTTPAPTPMCKDLFLKEFISSTWSDCQDW